MYKEYLDTGVHSDGFLFSDNCFIRIENTFVQIIIYKFKYRHILIENIQ